MSIVSEISGTWREWKKGAMACVLLGFSVVAALMVSGLLSVGILLGWHFVGGDKASDEAVYNLGFVFAVLFVPISVGSMIEVIATSNKDQTVERINQ